jgi:hypothetical protein
VAESESTLREEAERELGLALCIYLRTDEDVLIQILAENWTTRAADKSETVMISAQSGYGMDATNLRNLQLRFS